MFILAPTADDSVRVISVATALLERPRTAVYTDPTSDPAEHHRQLDEALAILADAGVQAEPIPAIGDPAHEIITTAESRGVDLIVIGSQGMSAVRRFLLRVGRRSRRAPRHVRRARRALAQLAGEVARNGTVAGRARPVTLPLRHDNPVVPVASI